VGGAHLDLPAGAGVGRRGAEALGASGRHPAQALQHWRGWELVAFPHDGERCQQLVAPAPLLLEQRLERAPALLSEVGSEGDDFAGGRLPAAARCIDLAREPQGRLARATTSPAAGCRRPRTASISRASRRAASASAR
jgi:hypothetical protein